MNSVGIDISKGKSMVAALRPMGEVALPPKEYPHTAVGLEQMAYDIISLGENTRVFWPQILSITGSKLCPSFDIFASSVRQFFETLNTTFCAGCHRL